MNGLITGTYLLSVNREGQGRFVKNDPFEVAAKYQKQPGRDTAKRALTAAPQPAFFEKKEAPTCFNCGATMTPTKDIHGKALWECLSCAVGAGTAKPDGIAGDGASVVDQIVENGEIVAVLICSKPLAGHVWLAFDDSFDPKDGQAVFYADELEFLKTKDIETLKEIHKTKLAFWPGSRVKRC